MTDEEMAGGLTDAQMAAPPSGTMPRRHHYPEPKSMHQSDEELGIGTGPSHDLTNRERLFPGPSIQEGRPEVWTNNPEEAGDTLVQTGMLGMGAGKLVGPLLNAARVPAGAARVASRLATPAVEGGTANKTAGGDFTTGALLGAIPSTAAVAAGKLAGGFGRAVQGSRGAASRRFLEQHGENVGVTSPGRGGHITDSDIGAAAERADQSVKEGLTEFRNDVASKPYSEAAGRVTPDQARELVDVRPIFHDLNQSYYTPGIAPEVASRIKREIDIMEQRFMRSDGSVLMTQEGVNNLRRGLSEVVDFNSTDPRQRPLMSAFSKAKEIVDQGPYAEANRAFSEGDKSYRESLDMLDLSKSRRRDQPISGNLRVKAQRAGQNVVTAGADTERLDREAFREKHPELGRKLDEPEILRRSADIGFHVLPQAHGGLIDRTGSAISGAAMLEGLSHFLGHGHVNLTTAAAAAALGLGVRNLNGINARLLYTPALEALAAEQGLLAPTTGEGALAGQSARALLGQREKR